ncbi:MAG: entericidin A [Oceanipulchritudo sp.]
MKRNPKRFILLIAAIGFVSLAFNGCQTADGLGQDVENLGESIQD